MILIKFDPELSRICDICRRKFDNPTKFHLFFVNSFNYPAPVCRRCGIILEPKLQGLLDLVHIAYKGLGVDVGGCPFCGRVDDRAVDDQGVEWATCDKHRVQWNIGFASSDKRGPCRNFLRVNPVSGFQKFTVLREAQIREQKTKHLRTAPKKAKGLTVSKTA